MTRRALLIAVADYRYLPKLDYVGRDIPLLLPPLGRAGFPQEYITKFGANAEAPAEISSTELKRAISRFLGNATDADDLLILFSGHGVEIEGRRILMPQGYDSEYPESLDNLVWDGWIAAECRGSRARSVIVAIDACRTGAAINLAPASKGEAPKKPVERPLSGDFAGPGTDAPTLAFCYSCAPGENSGPDRDRTCSAFTRAVAEVLGAETGPAQFDRFIEAVDEELGQIALRPQKAVSSGRDGRGGPWAGLVIKEDAAARFRQRIQSSKWCTRLRQIGLFAGLEKAPGFACQVQSIALEAETQVAEASRLLPGQRWRDEQTWARLLDLLWNVFLGPSAEAAEISAAEAAVFLAVPIVYEAALAAAEKQLVLSGPALDPLASTGAAKDTPLWLQWRNSFAAAEELDAHRARLVDRGFREAAEDVAAWRLTGFCHKSGELWDLSGGRDRRSGWAREAIEAVVAAAPVSEAQNDSRVCEVLSGERLLRLARLMFASLDDVVIEAGGGRDRGSLDPRATFGPFPNQLLVNEVRAAHLLNLSAQMTLDARRLSPLLSEHLGPDNDLQLSWLKDNLAKAKWQETETGNRRFTIQLECPHEAVDAALLAAVDGLESYRTGLLRRTDENASCTSDFLPAAFLTERLNYQALRRGAREPPTASLRAGPRSNNEPPYGTRTLRR